MKLVGSIRTVRRQFMSIAENKQGVRNFYDAAARGDMELVLLRWQMTSSVFGSD